ncbi:unnamed protein product [Polarella glacialis]|uniref:Uncharacterized protein n=1 Tax=Polarella glacialis TaxID=89957 RepID=A0A813IFK3_POLGL|nr:unnamed protein product [Polarella glacialis]CAE8652753.1 unnamed protein product [Polarella glacialis]
MLRQREGEAAKTEKGGGQARTGRNQAAALPLQEQQIPVRSNGLCSSSRSSSSPSSSSPSSRSRRRSSRLPLRLRTDPARNRTTALQPHRLKSLGSRTPLAWLNKLRLAKSPGEPPTFQRRFSLKLRQLLQRLPPASRKAVIEEIPQTMRRALELWMLDRRTQATRTDPEVSQKLCQRSGDSSGDTSDDSSHDSPECNEAEADCALALCDTTAACRDVSCGEVVSMSDDSSDMSEKEKEDTSVFVFSGASVPDKTLSIMGQQQQQQQDQQQSLEEEFPPEVAAEGPRRSGHGRTGVRGIIFHMKDASYGASHRIGIFRLMSKLVPDLATALDYLAIITVLKQRAQHGVLDGDNFEDCMRRALLETESEVGVKAMEDVGLKFSLTLNKSYWIGPTTQVHTPRTACLETALAYRRKFAELQQALSHRGVVRRGLLNRFSIADLEDNWHRFSALYIEACCGLLGCSLGLLFT